MSLRTRARFLAALPIVWIAAAGAAAEPSPLATNPVGVEGRLEILLPGPALRAAPVEPDAAVELRVASARAEGKGFRYDLRFIGLVPGVQDLGPLLRNPDGSAPATLPPLKVSIERRLPLGHDGRLLAPVPSPPPAPRPYAAAVALLAVAWAALGLLLWRSRKPKPAPARQPVAEAPTFQERVRPLVLRALDRTADPAERAELERMLLVHWCERLRLGSLSPGDAILKLKAHPEAGALVDALETWLHAPEPGGIEGIRPWLEAHLEPAPGEERR